MLKEIAEVMRKFCLDEIYLTGFIDFEENQLSEFVANPDYLIFEFGGQLINIQSIEQYSKLSITKVDTIKIDIDLEDVIPAKSRISGVIFNNPMMDNKIAKIELFNLEVNNCELICDALKLILSNNQEIFLDPSFLGINIGGSEVEELWKYNLPDGYNTQSTIIEF
ncbi:hypothetical protein NQ117_16820 [Paenibacillus sp. SC116]|uniref:hypothetical protein n=1 Tax=Paenibacillus sp. SC116 TaxID=2968986 RepID=UPI00215A44D7|nr:hypothetical protein [Paenibacillus sp. SC116]MCR8845346.1 hypothetical protein [Paenibacillus sp. SC116]